MAAPNVIGVSTPTTVSTFNSDGQSGSINSTSRSDSSTIIGASYGPSRTFTGNLDLSSNLLVARFFTGGTNVQQVQAVFIDSSNREMVFTLTGLGFFSIASAINQPLLFDLNSGLHSAVDAGFDNTVIARLDIRSFPNFSSGSYHEYRLDNIRVISTITCIGGEVGNQGDFETIYDYLVSTLGNISLASKSGDVYTFFTPRIQIANNSTATDFFALGQVAVWPTASVGVGTFYYVGSNSLSFQDISTIVLDSCSFFDWSTINLNFVNASGSVFKSAGNITTIFPGSLTPATLAGGAGGLIIDIAGTYDISQARFSGNTNNVVVDGVAATLELSADQFASYNLDPANFPVAAINSGSVTVTGPLVALAAPNFVNGVRFFAARQQTFEIQSADINTTANTIALGNDNETGDAFARQITSPATLVLLTLATGATIPTSSPQIVDGNLYYVVANTSGVIQISETEGGAAIDFTDSGTQNGGGELFNLRCETELINQVVSGGAGVSQSLTLPNDAILNVAAIHRASASSCSTLFERQLQWSSTTGATIPDTFSATNNPDTIHNALVGATIRSKSGLSVSVSNDGATVTGLAFDLSGNIELDANAITDNTMSFPDGYLWAKYVQSLQTGIRFIRSQFSAVGIMDYRFDKLRLDNVADGVRNSPATTLTIYGNVEPTTPGQSVIASGSATVHIIPFYVSDIESTIGGTGGTLSYDLPQFIALLRADAAFKRALSEGALIAGLADELALIKTQVWTRSDVRTAWNTLITNAGVTAPSVGEVSVWNGYAALLTGLSFASNGEVSYAG